MYSGSVEIISSNISSNLADVIEEVCQEWRNAEVGFYATFSHLANLFPENIKFVNTDNVGINIEQRNQLQNKSLAMREAVGSCDLDKTKNVLDKYEMGMLTEAEMNVIAKLAEEVVTNEKALDSLEDLVKSFHEIMQLSLSSDHRVLIGAFVSAATYFIFLAKLCLEDLKSLLIGSGAVDMAGVFEAGGCFCKNFKKLDDFYYENRVEMPSN